MSKSILIGTDENGCKISVNDDIVNFVGYTDRMESFSETMTINKFKRKLGL